MSTDTAPHTYAVDDAVWAKPWCQTEELAGKITLIDPTANTRYRVKLGDGEASWFTAEQLRPRDVAPKPTTWRLPEVGDTIQVTATPSKSFGKWLKVIDISWDANYPIGTTEGNFRISQVKLVRLHDKPEPQEAVKVEPASKMWVPKIGEDVVHEKYGRGQVLRHYLNRASIGLWVAVAFESGVVDTMTSELKPAPPQPDPKPEHDPVHHPKHYTSHPSGIECIEVTRHFGFNIGNVIKYCWREAEKGAPLQDLKKAAWYLNDEIQRREKASASQEPT